jgi:hypothetical protein
LWPEPLRAQVGCCEESDFTACVGEGALLGALGRGSDDNNTTRGCRAEEACVRVCGCEFYWVRRKVVVRVSENRSA